jgi:cytochrome c
LRIARAAIGNAPDLSLKDARPMISRFALAASLALALAACGSSSPPTDQASEAAPVPSEAASATPAAAVSEAAPSEAPATAASAVPSPSPTPTPSAKPSPDTAATGAGAPPTPQAFNQCTACHSTTPGKTIIGPSLAHVYGRKAGTLAGFQYSDAMKNAGFAWTSANLDAFLSNPAAKVPGTLMALGGIKDAAQRKAIIDYLKTL